MNAKITPKPLLSKHLNLVLDQLERVSIFDKQTGINIPRKQKDDSKDKGSKP
jgi:hypothetical protein